MVASKTLHPYDIREPMETVVENIIRTGTFAQNLVGGVTADGRRMTTWGTSFMARIAVDCA